MKSNYQKLTMITCLLAGALSLAAIAQESPEREPDSIDSEQPLSPETEMAIMRVMNLENRIQTLQTVPAKMTDNELAGHFSGTLDLLHDDEAEWSVGAGHHGNPTRTRRG